MSSDLKYWAALSLIPGLGASRIKLLFEHFGSISAIWDSTFDELVSIDGIGAATARSLIVGRKNPDGTALPPGVNAVCLGDSDYPSNLYNIWDPPPVLYYRGSLEAEDKLSVAVVGSRSLSPYGEKMTKKLAKDLCEFGITVVSGLALGIDSCAHKSALEAGGRTIAVLGTGLDEVYPYSNRGLGERIGDKGALVCEHLKVEGVEKWNFPRRNRIISGLSLGTLVIEGSSDSGSLITAGFALEQNREVFAVPGESGRTLSRGPNALIKRGAKLVEEVADILEELNLKSVKGGHKPAPSINTEGLSAEQRRVLDCLETGAKHIDELALITGVSCGELATALVPMVVKDMVSELPGKYYCAR
ncbi:MAG: DNA-processing protein DprA [Candidatus Margulisiibacteriota bacterium]